MLFDTKPRQGGSIQIVERSMFKDMPIDDLSTNSNFDSLNGIHNQKSQLPVEDISFPDGIQRCAGDQPLIRVARDTEGMPIGTEPVVIDRRQPIYQFGAIRNKTAGKQEVGLCRERKGRLLVLHAALPENKNPPNLSMP